MKLFYVFILIAISFLGCKKNKIENKGACSSSFNVPNATITIENSANNIFCFSPNLNYQIDLGNLDLHTINWENGDTTNIITVTELGLFEGSGINSNNDTIDFSFEAVSCSDKIYVPTVFTPNGDGVNDTWGINFLEEVACSEDFSLIILNNSHQIIFKTSDISSNWNGKQSGLDAPIALYHYLVKYKQSDGDMQDLNGSFLLVR